MREHTAVNENEQHLIGALLRDPDSLHQAAAAGVGTGDLIDEWASRALSAILSLDLDRAPITPATVADRASLPLTALEIWKADAGPEDVGYLSRLVRREALRRRIDADLRGLLERNLAAEDPSQVLAAMHDCSQAETASSAFRDVGDYVDAAIDSIDPSRRSSSVYTTGVPGLDRALGGGIQMHDEQLVIGADTGVGKTTLALGIAEHIADKYGCYPSFFSLEMTGQSVAAKLIGRVAGVPIRKASYSAHEWAKLRDAAEYVRSLPLKLSDVSPTAESIESEIRAHVRENGAAPVFVDYIQLMDSNERNAVDRIAEVSKVLRRTGRNLGVPIIALAQLNREGAKAQKQPTMHDFYGSGQIEKDCTAALLMWRPDPETGEVLGILDKRRFSPVEDVDGRPRIVSPKMLWAWHGSGQRFICGVCEAEPCRCRR